MLLKYTRDYASPYTNKMANLPLKWLFPRVLRAGKRTQIASGSDFCPRGHLSARQSHAYGNMTYVHNVKRFLQNRRLVGACTAQTKPAPNPLQKHAPWKAGFTLLDEADRKTRCLSSVSRRYSCLGSENIGFGFMI